MLNAIDTLGYHSFPQWVDVDMLENRSRKSLGPTLGGWGGVGGEGMEGNAGEGQDAPPLKAS